MSRFYNASSLEQKEMSLNSDILSWFRANQYLLLLLNKVYHVSAEKDQIFGYTKTRI